MPVRNPFRFGQIVAAEHFCDRADELGLMEGNVAGGQHVVLYSPRRMGKSSLMARLKDRLTAQGLVVSRVDFYALNSAVKIIQEVARACGRAVLEESGSIQKFLERLATVFKRLRFKFTPGPNGSVRIEPELVIPLEIRANLTDALVSLDEFLMERGKRGVLIFDEFQEVSLVNENLEPELRTVIQTLRHMAIAFLGSKAHIITRMFTDRGRPFYMAAKLVELGPISPEYFVPFIKDRFVVGGLAISDELAGTICAICGGHPDYTQRLCSQVFDKAIGKEGAITKELIDEAVHEMVRSCGNMYVSQWEGLPLRQQQVLAILAEHGPQRRVSSTLLAPYDMAVTSFHTALRELVKRGEVIKDEDRLFQIADRFFARWIAGEREMWT